MPFFFILCCEHIKKNEAFEKHGVPASRGGDKVLGGGLNTVDYSAGSLRANVWLFSSSSSFLHTRYSLHQLGLVFLVGFFFFSFVTFLFFMSFRKENTTSLLIPDTSNVFVAIHGGIYYPAGGNEFIGKCLLGGGGTLEERFYIPNSVHTLTQTHIHTSSSKILDAQEMMHPSCLSCAN